MVSWRPGTSIIGVAALVIGLASVAGGMTADAATVTCPTVSTGGVVTPPPTQGVDWSGCDLSGANLSHANLKQANLTSASLTDATLHYTLLKGANLSGTDFTGADLTSVDSGGSIIASPAPTLPANWQFINGYLVGPGAFLGDAALNNVDLSSADLAGAFLGEANLSGANLSSANLSGANLGPANLANSNLSGTNLTNATLDGVLSGGITASSAPTLPANWQLRSGFLAGPGTDLTHDNATGADFSGTDLAGADLYGTTMANANLSNANLTGIQGAGLDLAGANLADANLTDASIAYAAFGAGAPTVQGANFTGAIMTGLATAFLAGGPPAALPQHWMFAAGFLLGPRANLNVDAYINYTDLTGVDLAFANMNFLGFQHDNFTRANLWGSITQAGNFYQDTWSDTVCPDGTSSDLYVAGCFSTKLYEFAGTISPKAGSTLRKASRHFTVTFRLYATKGTRITPGQAAALAAGHDVRAVLTGPAIRRTLAGCAWNSTSLLFACRFTIPRSVKTGKNYSITVQENQGAGFEAAPAISPATNPVHIRFR